MEMEIKTLTAEKLREILATSGEVDGVDFAWEWESWNENPLQRRKTLLAELLVNLPLGIADSAPILTDLRIRDGFLKTFHDLVKAGETAKVEGLLGGLVDFARGSKGEVRGMSLVCLAGCLWLLGSVEGLTAISELEEVQDVSLWQLLDIAIRHDVPSSVWGSSLEAVSLQSCLQGAS